MDLSRVDPNVHLHESQKATEDRRRDWADFQRRQQDSEFGSVPVLADKSGRVTETTRLSAPRHGH